MVRIIGIMEHNLSRLSGIEPAGIHSGDSNAVLPPFDLSEKVIQQDLSRHSGIREHTHDLSRLSGKIALALKTVGKRAPRNYPSGCARVFAAHTSLRGPSHSLGYAPVLTPCLVAKSSSLATDNSSEVPSSEHPVRHQGRGGVRDRGQPARVW